MYLLTYGEEREQPTNDVGFYFVRISVVKKSKLIKFSRLGS